MERINFKKSIDERNYETFYFKRNTDKEFRISFEGNLDLYFSLNNFNDEPYFIIDKSNYIIYELFDKLYNDIKNCNIFKNSDNLFKSFYYNEEYKNRYEYKDLFNDGIITWKCDDYYYDIAPSFSIIKEQDKYIIKFNPVKESEEFDDLFMFHPKNSISVRIRNSGSRYHPFNIIFMRLYNSLSKIDELDLDQVHMEEYLLEKKKKLTK